MKDPAFMMWLCGHKVVVALLYAILRKEEGHGSTQPLLI
jgi:hypothetical protein